MPANKSRLFNISPKSILQLSVIISTLSGLTSPSVAANKSKIFESAKTRVEQLCAQLLLSDQNKKLAKELQSTLKLIKKSPLKYKESHWINDPGIVDLNSIDLVSADSENVDPNLLNLPRHSYNLTVTSDINNLVNHIEDLLKVRDYQKENPKPDGEDYRFSIGGDVKAGLKILLNLAKIIQPANSTMVKQVLGEDYLDTVEKSKAMIKYISIAINRNYVSPIPDRLGFFSAVALFIDNLSSFNSPGHNPGEKATNLKNSNDVESDPIASSLWTKRKTKISDSNTYTGYDLETLPTLESLVSEYLKPKTGFGTRAGNRTIIDTSKMSGAEIAELEKKYNLRLVEYIDDKGLIQFKIRINVESRTGTFGPKITHPLGFKTNKIHFGGETEIKYDRKIFQEYNSRSQFGTKVVLVPGTNIGPQTKRQKVWDAFGDIRGARLKSGQKITSKELEELLLIDSTKSADNIPAHLVSRATRKTPLNNFSDENFNVEMENEIDTILIEPVSVQPISPYRASVGSFEWAPLQNSREARALGLLFGFLNLHDVRSENTRLNIVDYTDLTDAIKSIIESKTNGTVISGEMSIAKGAFSRLQMMTVDELKSLKKSLQDEEGLELMLSDLGSNLGTSKGYGRYKGQDVNGMLWEIMTVSTDSLGNKKVTMDKFRPNQENLASEAMNIDDARWIGRKIAKLTEDQITAALISSGYTAPFVKLYVEKLVSRRDEIVRELELNVPLMRPNGVHKTISLDSSKEKVIAKLPTGEVVEAKASISWVLSNGQIIKKSDGVAYDPSTHHID